MENLLESEVFRDFIFSNTNFVTFKEILTSQTTNLYSLLLTITIITFPFLCIAIFQIGFFSSKKAFAIFLILIGLQIDIPLFFYAKSYTILSQQKINEIKSNISIQKNIISYPLKVVPSELTKQNTSSFIINNQTLNISPDDFTKYIEIQDNNEYILLEETSYIYNECSLLDKKIFDSYLQNRQKTNPEFFYKIKEIGYNTNK